MPLLNEWRNLGLGELFDFEYDLPPEYKCRFEKLFWSRYAFYCTNYETPQMFKHMLKSKLRELCPKYNKMYASENIISNPFVNYMSEKDDWTRNKGRSKDYSVSNNRGVETNENRNGGINVSRTGATNGNFGSNMSTNNANEKVKGIADNKDWTLQDMTDKPQNQMKSVDDTTGDVPLFNDGFVTTRSREMKRPANLNSSNKDNFSRTGEQATNYGFDNTEVYADDIQEGESITKVGSYTDDYNVSALENTRKNLIQEYGLRNITVSQILEEWRKTFIKIDEQFLDELRPLFLYIY